MVNLSEVFVGNSLKMCVFGDGFEKSSTLDSAIIGEMLIIEPA